MYETTVLYVENVFQWNFIGGVVSEKGKIIAANANCRVYFVYVVMVVYTTGKQGNPDKCQRELYELLEKSLMDELRHIVSLLKSIAYIFLKERT